MVGGVWCGVGRFGGCLVLHAVARLLVLDIIITRRLAQGVQKGYG